MLATWPTKPRSASSLEAFSASISPPSSPARPTAGAPARWSWATISLLIFPTSTIFTSSIVGASVTRRPCTKRTSRPNRSE